jgi:PPOX class probable F420-dependent enzyme
MTLPESHAELLDRPLCAHLATVHPDGSPQGSVMWLEWDGKHVQFTHTSTRQKFANLSREPGVAVSISDPDNPYRFLEVRGVVDSSPTRRRRSTAHCNSATATSTRLPTPTSGRSSGLARSGSSRREGHST